MRLIMVQKKSGIGQGYMEVLPYIEGDIVMAFSPDGNSIPELIPDRIDKMEQGMTWS